MKPIILIPARMASTRLPNKPLAVIGGLPMIVRVMQRAQQSGIGEVVVACDGREIADAVEAHGGRAVLTDPDLPSGSDRVYAALCQIDPQKNYDAVINVQGDMPTLEPNIILTALELLHNGLVDIGTLAAPLADGEADDSSVVKVRIRDAEFSIQGKKQGRALAFSRTILTTDHWPPATAYHHIGIYAYQREALEKFVSLPTSANEKREKLEQLRAMDAGMRMDVAIVNMVPLGVDTPEGLEKARRIYENI